MIVKSGAEGADNYVDHSMTFLNPLDAPIPKIPFSFFAEFRVWPPPGPGGQSR